MNTIQLKLLENKTIIAYWNNQAITYEGGYRIVAGEENATIFEISSVPKQYEHAYISIEMVNSQSLLINPPVQIVDNQFTLPLGMAVAGYGYILFTITTAEEVVKWVPLKVKIWDTLPDWEIGTITPTDELIAEIERLERRVNALTAAKVDRAGDIMTGELIISTPAETPALTLNNDNSNISLSLTTEERDGATQGLILGDKNNALTLTYFDAPLLYENGERVYSANSPPPFRLTLQGQIETAKIRENDYILLDIE